MSQGVCPWWLGYLLACPLRRLFQNPEEIFRPFLREGMTVLDVGCAMGFFTLPLAGLVGPNGRVIAVDMQERMIRSLKKRATKAALDSRIETRICSSGGLGIDDLACQIDLAVAFAVVHEVPTPASLFAEIRPSLKADGKFLIAEPTGHVHSDQFEETVRIAEQAGFCIVERPDIRRSRSVLLRPIERGGKS